MKKYLLLCLLGVLPLTSWSQVVTNDEPDDEDEIIVTDQEGNEEVIEFPEAMTYDLDSLMNLYMAKTYLEEDNDCNMRDVNPVYSREEYIERLSRMPCVMEMSYNEVVQKFIDRYSGRLRHSISYMLGASNFYMPIFEEALEMYQVAFGIKVPARHRVGSEPQGCQPRWSRWLVAIHADHRQAIWTASQLTGRRTP